MLRYFTINRLSIQIDADVDDKALGRDLVKIAREAVEHINLALQRSGLDAQPQIMNGDSISLSQIEVGNPIDGDESEE